jgi:hypothetical protein
MQIHSPELIKRVTDVLDEVIPAIPVNETTSALINRVARCIAKAAGEGQTSYQSLLAVASAEIDMISRIQGKTPKADRVAVKPKPGAAPMNAPRLSLAGARSALTAGASTDVSEIPG